MKAQKSISSKYIPLAQKYVPHAKKYECLQKKITGIPKI